MDRRLPTHVSTLICHRDVSTAIQCLGSMVRNVGAMRLVLHDDGTLSSDDAARLKAALPIAAIVARREADETMSEKLRRYPACRRARSENVLMLKLFDVALMREDDVRYCDTDILFFRPVTNLLELPPALSAVFMSDVIHAYAVRPWHLWPGNRLRLPRHLNSGMFVFARAAFDLDYLEWLLSRESLRRAFAHMAWWAEQTCWAALAFRAGCGLWDPQLVAVVDEHWTLQDQTVAAHFVSSFRGRLGQAFEAAGKHATGTEELTVRVLQASQCTALTLAKSQLARRLRRAGLAF